MQTATQEPLEGEISHGDR